MRLILLILLITNLLSAQKVALVIGNSDYNTGRLPNPTKDADLIAQSLEAVGFKVTIKKNLTTLSQMKKAINDFAKTLQKDDIAVVYYAGHGVQCKGKNYLMPTKADVVRGGQLASEALDLDFLIGGVSEIKLAIVMLDACRNNTYPSCSKSQTRGLVQPTVADEGGMILSFATAPNDIALDGDGDHSPYAMALSKYMTQSMPIETYFRRVGGEVYNSTGSQRPMLKNSFYGDFSFVKGSTAYKPPIQNPNITTIGSLSWQNEPYSKTDKQHYDENTEGGKVWRYKGAKEYCSSLTLGGYEDWRLPTKDELHSLLTKSSSKNSKGYKYYIKKEFLEKMPSFDVEYKAATFWTSTSKDSSSFWVVRFGYGYGRWGYASDSYYVRCVRQ